MNTFEFPIDPAAREWLRQFANVVRSFPKTVTEAATNSDTSYKRKYHLPDSSGLVELILQSSKGTRLDSPALRAKIPSPTPREMQIHLYTAKGHDRPPRSCDIVDFAEGMDPEEVEKAFRFFAANKSAVSKGRPGRSLFGRGITDVLLGHKQGELYSYKDGVLTHAKFQFDIAAGKPRVVGQTIPKPSKQTLSEIHFKSGENGTCIRFSLSDDCSIPDEGTVVPLLSQFYMLRLINSDPGIVVRVFRYRAAGRVYNDTLEYDFPMGDVIGKFSFNLDIPKNLSKVDFSPLRVDGLVARAEVDAPLKGREARDARENGLLIVDENDAVLDLTFLPDFDGAPYLNKIFGLVRIVGIRPVLEHFLDQGKESPLTTTRDGFDPKHEFTQFLYGKFRDYLEPIYRKEEARQNKSKEDELSSQAKQRINDALRQLNKYLNELMGSGSGNGDGTEGPKDLPIQFIPSKVKLVVGQPRLVTLLVRLADAKTTGMIMTDSSNPKIEVYPNLLPIEKGITQKEFLAYRLTLKCDTLHETGIITALADGKTETLETKLEVTDVIATPVVEPPLEMEFRPAECKGQPNKENHAVLYVNLQVIPLGRRIEVSIVKSQGGISLLEEKEKKSQQLMLVLEKNHQIQTNLARMLVPWMGGGWGQAATIMAETKTPTGKIVTAVVVALIDREEEGGLIRDVKYRDLGNQKCSDLVDGIIYINSTHSLNRSVFGSSPEQYREAVDGDRTAQYRLCSIITEQSVFRLAEDFYLKNKLAIPWTAPITSIREFVDSKTHEFAPKLLRILMTAQ